MSHSSNICNFTTSGWWCFSVELAQKLRESHFLKSNVSDNFQINMNLVLSFRQIVQTAVPEIFQSLKECNALNVISNERSSSRHQTWRSLPYFAFFTRPSIETVLTVTLDLDRRWYISHNRQMQKKLQSWNQATQYVQKQSRSRFRYFFFLSENIFPASGEYSTKVVCVDIMVALNRTKRL